MTDKLLVESLRVNSGGLCVQKTLLKIGFDGDNESSCKLWEDVKAHWENLEKELGRNYSEDIQEIESCDSGNPDTFFREVLIQGIANVLGAPEWPSNSLPLHLYSDYETMIINGLEARCIRRRTTYE